MYHARHVIWAVPVLALLGGCVSPKYNYVPQTTEISEPPLNTVVTAYVGDNMVRQGQYTEYDAIYLREDVRVGIVGEVKVTRGYYLKKGEDAESEFYLPAGGLDSGRVIVSQGAVPVEAIRLVRKDGRLCAVATNGMEDCTAKADYERKKYPVTSPDSFQQTLIYSGKAGDKINIGYREFSGSLARPAFNNEVEYDLSQSKVIGYKGARIEVIEATNEQITYKVIQNFNKAER
jgi:hypothetical protein